MNNKLNKTSSCTPRSIAQLGKGNSYSGFRRDKWYETCICLCGLQKSIKILTKSRPGLHKWLDPCTQGLSLAEFNEDSYGEKAVVL